jgi:predicted Zn-dependent peptidase
MPEIRSVSLGFWVGVGSRDEPAEVAGSSHFLEHLLFKGTQRRDAAGIAEAFDAVGGEANAYSAKEYTCLYARVLDKDLPMTVEILTDMLRAPALRADEVESERKVILEEIAMHDDTPDDLVHDLLAEVVFGGHPLAREVMGTVESVNAISRDGLSDFHDAFYIPTNLVVAAAGSVDHKSLVEMITASFEEGRSTRAPRLPATPVQAGRLAVVNRTTEQAHIAIGGIGYGYRHPDRFAWGVLDTVLGGGMSSRLFQEIRERRGLAYSVYSYRSTYGETGLFGVYAGTAPGNAAEVTKIILAELDGMIEKGVTDQELERAKGHMSGGLVLGLEDPGSRMSRLGKSELVHGEILSVDDLIARVEAVTRDDVLRVAKELLGPQSRALAAIGPFEEKDFQVIFSP